jgi:hypothetical protein
MARVQYGFFRLDIAREQLYLALLQNKIFLSKHISPQSPFASIVDICRRIFVLGYKLLDESPQMFQLGA